MKLIHTTFHAVAAAALLVAAGTVHAQAAIGAARGPAHPASGPRLAPRPPRTRSRLAPWGCPGPAG